MKKALFLDIDGTLVSFKTHTIPQSTINALQQAKQNGHKIFIATGRPKVIINNLAAIESLNIIDGYITMNGAYCFENSNVIYKRAIPKKEVIALATFCEEHNIACFFVSEHDISLCQPNLLVKQIFYDFLHVDEAPIASFNEVIKTDIFQITPFFTTEQENKIKPKISNCEIGRWHPAFADITIKGSNKEKGIREVINYFNIAHEDTIAIGDGGNDISMLNYANIGIAMGQATDEVKAAANYVTTSVDDNGIENALKHFGII